MGLILDTNCFSRVFNKKNAEHAEFAPVLNWLLDKDGVLIYGGSKYLEELRRCPQYLKIFRLLNRFNKAQTVSKSEVDKFEKILKQQVTNSDVDDYHLVAIIYISKCRLVCTRDQRSISFLKDSGLYTGHCKKPKLYTSSKNAKLLYGKYARDMKPCFLQKAERESVVGAISGILGYEKNE